MPHKILLLTILLFAFTSAGEGREPVKFDLDKNDVIKILDFKFKPGDDSSWSAVSYNDSLWEEITISGLQNLNIKKYWIRTAILLKGDFLDTSVLELRLFNIPSAYEVYWDGQLIGANGNVGNDPISEVAGQFRHNLNIGRKFTELGGHILAIRISNFNENSNGGFSGVYLGYTTFSKLSRNLSENILYLGIFFTAFLFCFSVFIGGWRHKSFLLFGLFMFYYFLLGLWAYLVQSNELSLNAYLLLSPFFSFGDLFAFALLLLFIIHYMEAKAKLFHFLIPVAAALILSFAPVNIDRGIKVNINQILFMSYGIFVIAASSRNKIPGSYFLLSAVGMYLFYSVYILLNTLFEISGFSFIINLIANILFTSLIITAISIKIQQQTKRYNEMLIKSQRLETELLKKSIQPHFISNTLLSLKSWIVNDSAKAGRLIDALSEEFDIINQISSEKEITVEKEIELCRFHLELMGYRRDAEYKFSISNVNLSNKIPPMIFHTLIENGLTHAFKPKENGIFSLDCVSRNGWIIYTLSNNGSRLEQYMNQPADKIEEGLGIKYVKSRLEENYPGRWEMHYGLKKGLWEVIIKIN